MTDKLILDKIYLALLSMRDARDMLRESAKKKEKDFINDSPVKEAVEHAMGEMMTSMGLSSPLSAALEKCIYTLAHELLCVGGIALDIDGAKIEFHKPPVYQVSHSGIPTKNSIPLPYKG